MGLALSACSRDREVVQASDDAPIRVETTQLFVTIENRAGGALLDISVAILPVGFPPFTRLISRLENAEKRDLSLSDFTSRDGTTFNLRLVRPKTVRVTATDLTLELEEVRAELGRLSAVLPERIDIDPDDVERGLAGLVLGLVELLRQVLEKQAVRRMEVGTLSDDEIERVGLALMRLERKVRELAEHFGLDEDDLRIGVGVAS